MWLFATVKFIENLTGVVDFFSKCRFYSKKYINLTGL